MRFYAELVNASVVEPEDFMDFLTKVWLPVTEEETPEKAKDCYAYMVMSALVSATPTLALHAKKALAAFYTDRLQVYMEKERSKRKNTIQMMRPFHHEMSYDQLDVCGLFFSLLC